METDTNSKKRMQQEYVSLQLFMLVFIFLSAKKEQQIYSRDFLAGNLTFSQWKTFGQM